jgi:hypothetical protein
MKSFSFVSRALCLGVLATGLAAAQVEHNPVPTRVKVEGYGPASGTPVPHALAVRLETPPDGQAAVRVSGGFPGELAGLFIGRRAAEIPLPFEGMLLVEPVLSVFGAFDSDGRFGAPIDPADPALIGDLHFQGLHYVVPAPGKPAVVIFQLTQGLKVTIVPGNEQPALSYSGPPLTATLIAGGAAGEPSFRLLNQVVVPGTGFDLRLEGVDLDAGVTRVYLTLEAPNPNTGVLPVLETKRLPVDLGLVGERIEIQIQQITRDLPSLPVFALAAVIEPRF